MHIKTWVATVLNIDQVMIKGSPQPAFLKDQILIECKVSMEFIAICIVDNSKRTSLRKPSEELSNKFKSHGDYGGSIEYQNPVAGES